MKIFRSRAWALPALLCLFSFLPGCAWFVMGGVAAGLVAMQEPEETVVAEVNDIPSVVVSTPGRLKTSPALIPYTLLDPEGSNCDVTAEMSLNGGSVWSPATEGPGGDGLTNLTASAGGVAHTFDWDFASDITLPEQQVRLRFRPFDGQDNGAWAETGDFTVGNVQPLVTQIDTPMSTVTGTATITYILSDTQADPAEIEIQFKRETDPNDWATYGFPCSPEVSGMTTGLSTSAAGVTHLFPWDTQGAQDLPGENADVTVRIRARDGTGAWGAWTVSGNVAFIRNNSPPYVLVGVMNASQSGLVYIPYTCYDDESHEVSIMTEYLEFGSSTWRRATAGPGTTALRFPSSPSGVPGLFVWDSRRDGVTNTSVTVRVVPSEPDLEGRPASANFAIGNGNQGAWSLKANLPGILRTDAAVVETGGRIYVIGGSLGLARNEVWSYDPASDMWTQHTNLPTGRGSAAYAAVGGKIYIIGGTTGLLHNSGHVPLAVVEEYDPAQDTWNATPKAAMTTARYSPACAVHLGKIYVTGGATGGDPSNLPQPLATVEMYDPVADTWTPKAPMPATRFDHACATFGDRIYAVGGRQTTYGDMQTSLYAYDPAGNAWSTLASMPTARGGLSTLVHGGLLWALGGGAAFNGTTVVERFDPGSGAWLTGPVLPRPRTSHGSVNLEGRLYVVGGNEGGQSYREVDTLDPSAQGSCSACANLPTARGRACSAPGNGTLHVIGGEGTTTGNDRYDPATNTWTAQVPMTTPRMGACSAVVGNTIYVFGGTLDYVNILNTVEAFDSSTGTWTTGLTPMPTPRADAMCAAVGGKVYVIAGGNGPPYAEVATVEAYDPVGNTWTTGLANIPTARTRAPCAAVDGKIIVIGGLRPSVALPGSVSEIYDPATDTWATIPNPPTLTWDAAGVGLGAMFYQMGGRAMVGGSIDEVWAYDIHRRFWRPRKGIPTSRFYLTAAPLKDVIYAVGGGQMFTLQSEVEAFRIARDPVIRTLGTMMTPVTGATLAAVDNELFHVGGKIQGMNASDVASKRPFIEDILPGTGGTNFEVKEDWESLGSLNQARAFAGTAAYSSIVFVLGGVDDTNQPLASMESYDPMFDAWSFEPPMPLARSGLGVLLVGDRIWAVGGDTGSGAKTGVVQIFNITTSTWDTSSTPAMNVARSHFGIGREPNTGRIYVFGGEGAGSATLASVEYYDPSTNTWTTAPGSLPEALEGALCLLEGGRLHLLGGERSNSTLSDRIWFYDSMSDVWKWEGKLPYAARDLYGCRTVHTWYHRDQTSNGEIHDEFTFFGGGWDGTAERGETFRFYTN
ncbi:MAG: Kelch repeat-containing protein [Planctomycetota bacterium]|jgi:N-acetylneuraminic acid mutarotase